MTRNQQQRVEKNSVKQRLSQSGKHVSQQSQKQQVQLLQYG